MMKRILPFAFLLLALAVPARAARTLYPAHSAMNWSQAKWSLADDDAQNQAKPATGAGDTVITTANTDTVTLDETPASLNTCTFGGGTIAGGSETITVGAGGFEMDGTTISGTLDVDLSAAAGAYVQTAGTIDTGAVLSVDCGTGGFAYTALTNNGTLNITIGAACSGAWPATSLTSLTVNATFTPSGTTFVKALAGSGAIATGTFSRLYVLPPAPNFWTYDGTPTGTGTINIRSSLAYSNALAIAVSPAGLNIETSNDILTASGGVTCGLLSIAGTSDGNYAHLTVVGSLTCTSIAFGKAAKPLRDGRLTLSPNGVYRVTGNMGDVGGADGHQLNLQGRLILEGTFDGTDFTVTPTHEGVIDCFGVGRVTAVTSTGRRLVVRRAVDAAGNPVRSWNGDGCTNVRFLGRRLVGSDN